MKEKPELADGNTRIANEIMEVLACTYMSSYESQFLWFLFRKTYGWQKKDDTIALSQFSAGTGMRRCHVSRTKKKLLQRRIVTQTGNKISFNKYHSQWVKLPKQVTPQGGSQIGNRVVPKQAIQVVPKREPTKETITKETITKERPEEKNEWSAEQTNSLKQQYAKAARSLGLCDTHYVDKLWDQGLGLRGKNRSEFLRKSTLLVSWSRIIKHYGKARKLHGEISGIVNDKTFFDNVH